MQDLVHHYDHHSPANKLESQIYAIVLLLCLQNHYRSDLSWTEDSLSQVYMKFIFEIHILIYLVKEYGLNLNLMAVSVP
jgi:hypothetical protein